MKKFKLIVLVLALFLVMPTMATMENAHVNALDTVTTVGAGSKDTPKEIASKIYYLQAGDTLILKEGYYKISGQAYLQHEGINIKGAGKDKTFIFVESANEGWGITVNGHSCSLQDMTVQRSDEPSNAAVIKVMGGNNATIKNVKTIGGYYGVDINPSLNTIVDGCEFTSTSKGSIGIGTANNTKSSVKITNTTTRNSGWNIDVMINDSTTYGSSTVTIGKGNVFTMGTLVNDNHTKSKIIFEDNVFPTYKETISGNKKLYTEIPTIQLSTKQLILEAGEKSHISGMASPTFSSKNIVWSSDNDKVATISAKGEITAIAPGTAQISATIDDVKATCEVSVFKIESTLPDIDVSKPTDKVDVGITDDASKDIVNDTSKNIVDSIINNRDIEETVISQETLDKVKTALDHGATIATKVETKSVTEAEVNKADVVEVKESIKSLITDTQSVKIAQYLDIGVMLQSQIGGVNEDLGNVYELDKPIMFTLAIPDDLKKDERDFYVVRIHDGVSTILETTKNDDGTLSFKTDQFSTYALVYTDVIETTITPTPVPPVEKTPETSDTSQINTMIMVMILSLVSYTYIKASKPKYK